MHFASAPPSLIPSWGPFPLPLKWCKRAFLHWTCSNSPNEAQAEVRRRPSFAQDTKGAPIPIRQMSCQVVIVDLPLGREPRVCKFLAFLIPNSLSLGTGAFTPSGSTSSPSVLFVKLNSELKAGKLPPHGEQLISGPALEKAKACGRPSPWYGRR